MTDGSVKPRHKLYIGVAASAALHLLVAGAFFVRLPTPQPAPPEESISVEIVPAPEEPPATQEPPEPQEQALDLTMPEQKPEEQKQDIPPPPEPPTQPAEEAGGEPPPPAAEEAKPAQAEEQPQPTEQQAEVPPQPQAEQAQAEPPPPLQPEEPLQPPAQPPAAPEPPAAADQSATPAQAAEEGGNQEQAQGQPLPVLRPVIEFGDEDAGPEAAPDGDAAEEEEVAQADVQPDGNDQPGETAEAPADTADQDPPEQENDLPAEDAAEPAETDSDEAGGPALPQDVAPPTVDADPAAGETSGSGPGTESLQAALAAEPPKKQPANKNSDDADGPAGKPLKEAKRLFSQKSTSDAAATTAMGHLSRDIRASQLCTTELKEQLLHGSPAFNPEILPSYRLPEGTVMDIGQAAFRANDQWYNVRFRCEINNKATKVVSFAVQVGDPVPRNQWRTRGFPDY